MSKYILTPEHKKKLLIANLGGNNGAFKKGHKPANKGKGMKYELRTCIICGKSFTNENRPVKTCSVKCGAISSSRKQRGKRIKVICISCKKEFETYPSWYKKDKRCFCSRKCQRSLQIRYSPSEKLKAARLIQLLILQGSIKRKPCEICGEIKDINAHHYKGYKRENWFDIKWLCKKHHADEHIRLRKSGEYKLL